MIYFPEKGSANISKQINKNSYLKRLVLLWTTKLKLSKRTVRLELDKAS